MDITTALLVFLLIFVLQNWWKTDNALYKQQCYIELLGGKIKELEKLKYLKAPMQKLWDLNGQDAEEHRARRVRGEALGHFS